MPEAPHEAAVEGTEQAEQRLDDVDRHQPLQIHAHARQERRHNVIKVLECSQKAQVEIPHVLLKLVQGTVHVKGGDAAIWVEAGVPSAVAVLVHAGDVALGAWGASRVLEVSALEDRLGGQRQLLLLQKGLARQAALGQEGG